MAFFKPEETTMEEKTIGQTKWHDVTFEFPNPRLVENKFNPEREQMAWGIIHQGQKMIWYISQTSVEKALNLIGATNMTTVRVAKVSTGPTAKEVEWLVEYVKGPRNPRDIRGELNGLPPTGQQDPPVEESKPEVSRRTDRPWDDDEDELNPIPSVGQVNRERKESNVPSNNETLYVYTPLSEEKLSLIQALARDEARISKTLIEEFRAEFGELADEMGDEQFYTFIRGAAVSLGYDILAMDRDMRMPFAGLRNYTVLGALPEPEDMDSSDLEVVVARIASITDQGEVVKQLFDFLVAVHDRVDHPEHAKGILKKKLGYEKLPKDAESLTSLVKEYIVYNDCREEGVSDVEACIEVSNQVGRHPALMPPIVNMEQDGEEEPTPEATG